MRRSRSERESEKVPRGASPHRTATPAMTQPLLDLQALAGNEVVNRLVDRHIQAKLVVGAGNDPAELQADRVADAVVQRLGQGGNDAVGPTPAAEAPPEVGADGGEVTAATERAITAAPGGSPLPAPVRRAMENALGADLGGVRIHTDARARGLNQRLQSRAFTLGSNIFFRDAGPDMTSSGGQHLLAHELAHTIQQGASPERGCAIQRAFGLELEVPVGHEIVGDPVPVGYEIVGDPVPVAALGRPPALEAAAAPAPDAAAGRGDDRVAGDLPGGPGPRRAGGEHGGGEVRHLQVNYDVPLRALAVGEAADERWRPRASRRPPRCWR
jgi:Domain of unknown function (DUF4157)